MFVNKKRSIVAYCMTVLLTIACLIGCNNHGDNTEASALLMKAMDALEASGAYSYKVETMIQRSDSCSEDVSEISVVVEPYALFAESTTGIENEDSLIIQTYQRENTDGSMDIFVRSANNSEREFGEWNLNHIPPELAELILSNAKGNMKPNIELLRANKALFTEEGNARIEDKDTIVLKGAISPDSAARIYNDYLRDLYRKMGMVEDKSLTVEAAKNEILTSEMPDLRIGIPALVFSPHNIPVTIWIDKETHMPIKLELDKKESMQALLTEEQIEKAVAAYTLLAEGPLVAIPTPDGIASL